MGKWTWAFVAIWIGLEAIVIASLGLAWQWTHRRAEEEHRPEASPAPRVPARAA